MKLFSILIVLLLAGCGVEIVDTGHRGVKTNFGEVIGEPLPEGLYFYNPFTSSINEYDIRTQRIDGDTETYTRDVQQAHIKYVINLNPAPDAVTDLIREVGRDWSDKLVPQIVLDALKEVVGKWDAVDLISNREKAKVAARDLIVERLALKNVRVTGFDLTDIAFTKEFETAVERKVVAIQKAIEEQNRTKQVEEMAKQQIITAQAEAESMRIRANALSQNQKLVEWEAVQKWDGKMPQYMLSGATPFINLK